MGKSCSVTIHGNNNEQVSFGYLFFYRGFEMKRVLFICLGNICRSPMAEAIFRQIVKEAGKEHEYVIDSAGTSDWHEGERPHKGTLDILAHYHVPTTQLYSRPLVHEDETRFDYFICMDQQNIKNARKIIRHKNLVRLAPIDIPDPYYTGDFEETYRLCEEGCRKLFQEIE